MESRACSDTVAALARPLAKPYRAGVAAAPDLELEDGDWLIVPKAPSSVTVEGQVYRANAFLYQNGKRVGEYLYLSGGPDSVDDRKREFILLANGSDLATICVRPSGWNFKNLQVFPGDTLVVPPKSHPPSYATWSILPRFYGAWSCGRSGRSAEIPLDSS